MKLALVSLCTVNGGLNPIGVLCLIGWIRKYRPQWEIELFEAIHGDPLPAIQQGDFDVVGLSAMTLEYERATKLASQLKCPIIIGGVHISIMPESFRDVFSVGVIGEGEETLCALLDLIENHEFNSASLRAIPGVVFKDQEKLIITADVNPIDLSDYPPMPWDVLPKSYWSRRALGIFGDFGVEAEILTTRGCPFRCSFCASTQFWGRVRAMPTDWIIRELVELMRYGVTHVQIVDDLFTVNKRRLKEVVQKIRANRLNHHLTFAGNSKANIIDDEICQLLKSINFNIVGFGFESGNDRVLSMLKSESATVQGNKNAIVLCVKHGLKTIGGVIFGSPTETIAEMEDSIAFINWAWKSGANRLFAFVLIPYPHTKMWDIAKQRGVVSDTMNFDQLDLNPENGALQRPLMLESSISLEAFGRIMQRATSAVHPFKWRKIRMFLSNAPLQTLLFALRFPWPLIKRTLNPKQL